MDSQIEKTTQSLSTTEQMRNQTQLIMQPYANWEQFLTPAPLSIAIMGELVFISSQTDFSINKNPPKDGYQYIKYPESFRACLMQVCNSGWWAFNEAHKNMDQIRLHTLAVPDHMKNVLKNLFRGSDEIDQAFLPDQLENIRVIADDCLTLACASEKGFTDVVNIIQELLEACVNAQHFYGEEVEVIKKVLEEHKQRKAMDSLPGGSNMMAMDSFGAQLYKSKNQKELTEILIAMRNCEVKERDFKITIQRLVKGMDAMSRVKEQWEKMVRFFPMDSNIEKTSLTTILHNFVSTSHKIQSLSYDEKLFVKYLLYSQAFQATNIAGLIHMISAAYTEVSVKHLMDQIFSLRKLVAMDKEKPEFVLKQQQLQNSCSAAQEAILQLVQKNKVDFERKTNSRQEKIEKELLAILPSTAPEGMKHIQAAVKSGFTEDEENDYI